jgi:cell division septal protein FtsQ
MDMVPAKKPTSSLPKHSSTKTARRFTVSASTRVILRQVAVGVGVLSTIGLLVWGVYHLTRLPALTITTISASGGETINPDEVRAVAEATLEGSYGALIPKRFFLFYPQRQLVAAIEQVDRIRAVSVRRIGLTNLSVTYGEHEPFALWCERSASDTCLFLNDRGYAFAPAPPLKGGNFIRFVATSTPQKGQTLLPSDDFWNIITFAELLAEQGLFVSSVEVDAVGDVYYELTTGGELRASRKDPAVAVADTVRTILSADQFAALSRGNFHYIDLRFGNKVYVSEEDVSLAVGSSTATTTDAALATGASDARSTTSDSVRATSAE